MNKLFSILFASLILISGIHLSIAKHFCCGQVEAVKWSLTGENASCGMESSEGTCPVHDGIASNCCGNEVSLLAVDNFAGPSSWQIEEISKQINQVFSIPVNQLLHSAIPDSRSYADVSPPDNLSANTVSLPKICVFRI